MSNKEKIDIIELRGDIELLYQTAKIVAESDSIGEAWSYCREYQRTKPEKQFSQTVCFEDELAAFRRDDDECGFEYLSCALSIYELYKPF